MLQVRLLGQSRVACDVAVRPEMGPLCLSSFDAFRRSWPRSAKQRPHLVVTTYAGLKEWRRCCMCARSNALCLGPSCPRIRICSVSVADQSLDGLPSSEPASTEPTFVCTSYALLNAWTERFKQHTWGAIILEYSSSVPFPHSFTAANLLALSCVQWLTINRALGCGRPAARFNTKWQDLYTAAQDLMRLTPEAKILVSKAASTAADSEDSAADAGELVRCVSAKAAKNHMSSTSGTFWSYMEPGVGMDAPEESLPATRALLNFLAQWSPSEANGYIRLTCPTFVNGAWVIRAEPCQADREMLRIAAANTAPERFEEMVDEYFQSTHCPLDFASLQCAICGSTSADVLMSCCASCFHRDCFLNELLCEPAGCPLCGLSVDAEFCKTLEAWLLTPGAFGVVDLSAPEVRSHDWSGQLTRQIITSDIQAALTALGQTGLTCRTARVHNGENLTNRIFTETRELPVATGKQTAPEKHELIYVFFAVRNTQMRELRYSADRERYVVVTLVAGIYDYAVPQIGRSNEPGQELRYKLVAS